MIFIFLRFLKLQNVEKKKKLVVVIGYKGSRAVREMTLPVKRETHNTFVRMGTF